MWNRINEQSIRIWVLQQLVNGQDLCVKLTNSVRPVNTPEDLDGMVLRVPNNSLYVEFFGACGAVTTPMNFSEVYNALQLNTLDGQENPIDVPYSNKFMRYRNTYQEQITWQMHGLWELTVNCMTV
mgnify:CR=1 FL=1